ncbi:MAG: hypothetical protein WC699_07000 [Bacteroidales bacterium]|jgi:glycosyltransferase involved in cell wall biosynthesis
MGQSKKRLKIAVILRTPGIEYDDRVRKECISLSKIADLKLLVAFENNVQEEGITSYGIPYQSFRLYTRERFRSGRYLLLKALEFYWKTKKQLKDYDLIWAHEEYNFLFPVMAKKGKFIWDLHEIPELFDRPILKELFHYIERRSKVIIHANPHRIQYLVERGMIKTPSKNRSIRNFPDETFINSNLEPPGYNDIKSWLSDRAYVYLQGISSPDRYPFNTIISIMRSTNLKIVVVGSFKNEEIIELLKSEFGQEFYERIYFTGMINQLATPSIIRNALFSMVFYQTNTPNERYCEANRFYQSLVFGVPVIVGSNEPMAELVEKYQCGIALASDGIDITAIEKAISKLINSIDYYKDKTTSIRERLLWSDLSIQNLCY